MSSYQINDGSYGAPQLVLGPTPGVNASPVELLKTPPGVTTTVETLYLVVHQLIVLNPTNLLLEWVDPTGQVITGHNTFIDPTA